MDRVDGMEEGEGKMGKGWDGRRDVRAGRGMVYHIYLFTMQSDFLVSSIARGYFVPPLREDRTVRYCTSQR